MPVLPRDFDYEDLERVYSSIVPEPSVIVTSPEMFSAIKSKFQRQQSQQGLSQLPLSFSGLRYNKAIITTGRYGPGTYLDYEDEVNPFVEWVKRVRKEEEIFESVQGS